MPKISYILSFIYHLLIFFSLLFVAVCYLSIFLANGFKNAKSILDDYFYIYNYYNYWELLSYDYELF